MADQIRGRLQGPVDCWLLHAVGFNRRKKAYVLSKAVRIPAPKPASYPQPGLKPRIAIENGADTGIG